MATASVLTKGRSRLLLAVAAGELAVGVLGLSATSGTHNVHPQPVAAVFEAAYTPPTTAAGVATAPDPAAAPTHSRPAVASSTRATPARRPTVKRPAATVKPLRTSTSAAVAAPSRAGWGCGAAIAWLSSHSAPGYQMVCPGYAEGHQAMTCNNTAACPGEHVIVIAVPCPAAYMNEAHNSWILSGLAVGKIDPYGYCATA